jgi:hypothetical protein
VWHSYTVSWYVAYLECAITKLHMCSGVAKLGCDIAKVGCGVAKMGCGISRRGCGIVKLECGVVG